jgi:V/A-type H+-transporting ATPase subunit G/H
MNNKYIQQVLEIEKQSQEIHEKAKREAQELPVLAEQEAQALIAKAKTEAQEEARQIVAQAQAKDEAEGILDEINKKKSEIEELANANLDKAVAYVLERVMGRA